MHKRPLILVIDDETAILHTLKAALEDEGFFVETTSDGSKALELIGNLIPDVVLLDIFMPHFDGTELLTQIKKEYPSQKVIMISGYGTIPIAIQAIQKGATDFIEKPLNLDYLLEKLSSIKNAQSCEELSDCGDNDYSHHGIVGTSSLFCELMQHVSLISALKEPVIIYGAPGSGKSLLARYMHAKGFCSAGELVTVVCRDHSVVPESLPQKPCTIFFKNIHELQEDGQKAVLALMEKNIQHRFLASSQPNLFKLVQKGTFNKSLFCKLNMTPIEIPSINSRRYDIPLLVDHFITQANLRCQKSVSLNAAAIRLLRNHIWHGDIAHIKTLIDSCVMLAQTEDKVLGVSDIRALIPERATDFVEEQRFSRFNSLQHATEIFQQQYILHLLKRYRYDTMQLAEFLQIPVSKLQDKMVELQINMR